MAHDRANFKHQHKDQVSHNILCPQVIRKILPSQSTFTIFLLVSWLRDEFDALRHSIVLDLCFGLLLYHFAEPSEQLDDINVITGTALQKFQAVLAS